MTKKKLSYREKKRKQIIISVIAVFVCILSLTIVYAALNTTLNISGIAEVNASTWDITIENSNSSYADGDTGDATHSTPIINGTSVSYTVNLTKPGDSVTLNFDVINNGDINGQVSAITNSTPICISSTGNTTDANLVCDNLEITFTYATGQTIKAGDVINQESYTCYKNESVGYSKTVLKVYVKLKDSMTSVPNSSVTVSNIKHEIIYEQSDKECEQNISCFVAGTEVLTKDGYRNIENLKVDDYIYTVNLETNTYELNRVMKTIENFTNEIYELTVDGHIIETTEKHQFYIKDKGWIQASELEVGDQLSTTLDKDTTITQIKIKKHKNKVPVYNLEVENHHNYLITKDKYLVHNATSSSGY